MKLVEVNGGCFSRVSLLVPLSLPDAHNTRNSRTSMKRRFFTLACHLGVLSVATWSLACVITTGETTSTNTSATSSTPTTSGSGTASTSSDTQGGTTDPSGTDASSSASGSSGGFSGCGWGPTGMNEVPNGYVCEGVQASDPDEIYPRECPPDLVSGASCGNVTGIGCCDANGDVWFCGGDDPGMLVMLEC